MQYILTIIVMLSYFQSNIVCVDIILHFILSESTISITVFSTLCHMHKFGVIEWTYEMYCTDII